MPKKSFSGKNLILAALSEDQYKRLSPHLESVALPLGEILYKSGDVIEYVYFPDDGIVSLVTHMNNGATIEVGLIGRDGMVGIPVLLGDDIAFEEAIVQIAGGARRMTSDALKKNLTRWQSPLLTLLLLYTRTLMKQVTQTAACNRRHTAEKRLARWLLMCYERVENNELALTQEFIANMLGTRRAGVSNAAVNLQTEGFIRYSRGHISILKKAELEEFACECYQAVKLNGNPYPQDKSDGVSASSQ
jgi:CRP-like cAMP-binding protein